MFLFDFFRSFLPLHNPIGFGASDFLLLVFGLLLLAAAVFWRRWMQPWAARFASKTAWCMLLLAVLPVVLRLALLPHHPTPSPDVYDEFSHLLMADTLRHFRLANLTHPLHQFFETQFVLQEPSYSSIYPPGQGLILALGWMVFGHPWAGVLLATAALCALCYWMLRGWVTPGWALAGGVLAVIEFGPLNQWMNGYWGGAAAAAAGCLVFGALPRLLRDARPRDAVLLGAGFGLHLLIRPYESIFLALSVVLFLTPALRQKGQWRILARVAPAAGLALLPAIGLLLVQNRQVTGQWLTMPYTASQYQYGVPAGFTFQQPAVPHRDLNREQALNYRMQLSFRGARETVTSFLERLEYRVRFYRFFFLAPLYLALPGFLWAMREQRFVWVGLTLALFALGSNFYPNFEPHYIAAVTCLFVLAAVVGLQQWERLSKDAAQLIASLCFASFIFWYSMHLFDTQEFSLGVRQYETWDGLNHRNPAARIAVNQQLNNMPGKLLVFVRYYPQHIFQEEWVYNSADIDGSRVVWARDLGADENAKLRAYYPDRSAWLLEPDFRPPRLRPYQ
ncbi:MAG TPA: hypothetical protein VG096_14940 [Bryobacteraceae bacterium]|jgi:hypothetical protein|nr:hypothetical protein [Bryobacteraceae bacterium]